MDQREGASFRLADPLGPFISGSQASRAHVAARDGGERFEWKSVFQGHPRTTTPGPPHTGRQDRRIWLGPTRGWQLRLQDGVEGKRHAYCSGVGISSCPNAFNHQGICADTDDGALGSLGFSCTLYYAYPYECSDWDDSDFTSSDIRCACGGGYQAVTASHTHLALLQPL